MGGYAFGIDSRSKEFLPDANTARCTLTPDGVRLLAECGYLPDLSKKWIVDKSKADGIAKLLVCIQALWMIIQTIGRLSGHLTVTLIEINTIGHVLCALGIYILWWYKPREVGQAVVLKGDWVAPLHAFMVMCSGVQSLAKEPDDMVYFPPSAPRGPTDTSIDETTDPRNARISRAAPISSSILHTDGTCGRFQTLKPHHAPQSHQDRIRSGVRFQHEHALQTRQISRHRLAAEAIHRHPVLTKFLAPAGERFRVSRNENSGWRDSDGVEGFCITRGREFVTTRAPNTGETGRGIFRRARHRAVMWFLTIVYGGIHMAAREYHFPSEVEELLWLLSTSYIVYIGGGGIVRDGLNTLIRRYARSTSYDSPNRFCQYFAYRTAKIWFWEGLEYSEYLVIIPAVLLYGLARVYIVIEAFISLRSMSADSYDTPNWSELIPHL